MRYLRGVRDLAAPALNSGAIVSLFHGRLGEAALFFLLSQGVKRIPLRSRSVSTMLTLPPTAPAFPCEIDLRREGGLLGSDRGVVAFVDGWLCFEGFRTTFSLSRSDVVKRAQARLDLKAGGSVVLRPDPGSPDFSGLLDRWYRLDSAAKGESVLPPLAAHASGLARTSVTLVMASSGAVACATFAVMFVAILGFEWIAIVSVLLMLLSAFYCGRHAHGSSRFLWAERHELANERPRPLSP